MHSSKRIVGNVFLLTSSLGAIFLTIEAGLQYLGKSICQTEGCRLVAQYARFSDLSILLIGIAAFSALSLLSFFTLYRNAPRLESYINLLLVLSLTAEGFFTGYQAFRLHNACAVCLATFGFVAVLGLLRIVYGEKTVIAGFFSFLSIFALFYLILPAGATVHFPEDEMVLFYGKDCKYCAEVMEELEKNKVEVSYLPAEQYSGFLKELGIDHVPTLYVNRKNQKIFLTGKEAVEKYLFCKQPEEPTKKAVAVTRKQKTGIQETSKNTSAADGPIGQSISHDISSNFIVGPDQAGVCKEDQKCE